MTSRRSQHGDARTRTRNRPPRGSHITHAFASVIDDGLRRQQHAGDAHHEVFEVVVDRQRHLAKLPAVLGVVQQVRGRGAVELADCWGRMLQAVNVHARTGGGLPRRVRKPPPPCRAKVNGTSSTYASSSAGPDSSRRRPPD